MLEIDLGPGAIRIVGANRDLDGIATLERVWTGPGQFPLEVGVLADGREIPPGRIRQAWRARRAGRAVPLILVLPLGERCRVCGPEGDPPPVRDLPGDVVVTLLRRALSLAPDVVVEALRAELARGMGSGGVPGLRNRGLVSTHFLVDVLPRRPEWPELVASGSRALRREGVELFSALGYEVSPAMASEIVLRAEHAPVAVAHLYAGAHQFDRAIEGGAPASTYALARAREHGATYALLVSGPIVRLLSAEVSRELGQSTPSAAFLEVATDVLPAPRAGVIGACYAPEALRQHGFFAQVVRPDSERFAVELRGRFRDRVYTEVVPHLLRGIASAASAARTGVAPDLLYRATMLALFRVLFVLYAEDASLLPVESPAYRPHSLTSRLEAIRRTAETGTFDPSKTDLWDDLQRIFAAIAAGHREWGVPAYDGGLFLDDAETSPEGALLARLRVSNPDFGPALYGLAVDRDEDGRTGKVDFGELGVRHLGNLYEGLLSYEVGIADEDLAVDEADPAHLYVPAQPGMEVKVRRGEPYMRSPKGGRKATGSYYTPAFVVDRLVEGSVVPAFERHLASLSPADSPGAAEQLWDFRVCDPAMGSGHFLVSVVDALTERIGRFLYERPLHAVADELERARVAVRNAAEQMGAAEIAEVEDIDILRRLVLKRCVYGVDLNPMAVELARLSLWLHAFVPGLPLSYLGHTMRHGNSLVGIVREEIGAFFGARHGIFGHAVKDRIEAALAPARDIARSADLELHEIERSATRQRELEGLTAELRPLLDAFSADPLVSGTMRRRMETGEILEAIEGKVDLELAALLRRSTEVCAELHAFHWLLAFPEVFLRGRPGFDAIVANPPWEEVTVEELGFYTRYIPGLKSERSGERQRVRIAEFVRRHPEVREAYERASREAETLRRYLKATFTLTKSGDPDHYKAFAERFLALCRDGGAVGVVLPRSAFAGEGTTPFREMLFGNAEAIQLDFLLNTGRWVFDMEPRYTIALLAANVATGRAASLSVAGPADSPAAFARLGEQRVEWSGEDLKSGDYAVPLVPGPEWAELFKHCYAVAPRFDADTGDWRAIPWRELDATNDRKSGLLRERGRGWPVYSGDSFDLWKPDHEAPPFVLDPKRGLAELQRKRQRSRVWTENFPARVLADPKTLPQHRARILFRDVSRATDSRTVRAALVPPGVFAVNIAPTLLFPRGDEAAQAYALGVLCSLPFDWLARRRVELHLNFFILNALSFPRPSPDDLRRRRIAELAARLACVDERFADFARACCVPHGPLGDAEKANYVAEIDALVAHLYQMGGAQLEIVFADFTAEAVPAARREAVRRHFARWASR